MIAQTLSQLIRHIDLNLLVEKYTGAGRRSGSGWVFSCPNPTHPDNKPSFSVFTGRDGKQRCSCLSACGFTGDALAFLKWHLGCSTGEAANILSELAGHHEASDNLTPAPKRQLVATEAAPAEDEPEAMASYLEGRGWPSDVGEAFGLTVMRDNFGTLRVRHPFYSFTSSGERVEAGWQARRLDSSQKFKWMGPKDVSLPLYNLPALEADDLTNAIICEGPADTITAVLATREHLGYACVGVAGSKSWRSEYAELFGGLHVLIACDGDDAGDKLADNIAADVLGVAQSVSRVQLLRGHDITELAKTQNIKELERFLTASPKTFVAVEVLQTLCQVCKAETYGALCPICEAWGQATPLHSWRVCDTCKELACTTSGRKCFMSSGCKGSFIAKVVTS